MSQELSLGVRKMINCVLVVFIKFQSPPNIYQVSVTNIDTNTGQVPPSQPSQLLLHTDQYSTMDFDLNINDFKFFKIEEKLEKMLKIYLKFLSSFSRVGVTVTFRIFTGVCSLPGSTQSVWPGLSIISTRKCQMQGNC